jgi:hypothetical protein
MSRVVVLNVLLCLTLAVLVLSPTTLSVRAVTPQPSYVPAVMPGQFAQYQVLKNTCHSSIPEVCALLKNSLNDTTYQAVNVSTVSGSMITLQRISIYANGTGTQQGGLVDVATGFSNITIFGFVSGDFFVLAGNLQAPNPIWGNPSAPTFNSTSNEMVLGATRSVNFLNSSVTEPPSMGTAFSETSGFAFDRPSGFLIEVNLSVTFVTSGVTTTLDLALRMVDNNIWRTAYLPDFNVSSNPITINIVGSSTGTSTITLTRLYSFTATVKLTATPSSSSLTCSLSASTLAMGGSDTSTLSCAGSPGTYTVSVSGDGGYSIHSASISVSIADFQISHSGVISFQAGSSGTATITIAAQNGYSASTTLEIVNVPSGLTCNLSSNSVSGYGSVTLTCSGQPGSYTVTVKATGGGTSHSTDTPVTVSAAQAPTQPASNLPTIAVYGGIGVVAVIAALVALLFLRRRPKGAVVPPSGASAPTTQP